MENSFFVFFFVWKKKKKKKKERKMAHFANRGILIFIGVGLLLALWNRTKDYSLEYDTVPYFFPEVPSPVLTGFFFFFGQERGKRKR